MLLGLLDVSGAGVLKCEDMSQTCCYQDDVIQEIEVPEPSLEIEKDASYDEYDNYDDPIICSTLTKEGYRYITLSSDM